MLYEKFVSERRDLPFVYLCHKDVDLKPGIKYGPVIRDCFIIELCTSGVGSVIINGKEFPLKTGDCYFLFPGDTVIHTADIHNPRSGIWAAFDGIMIEDALKRGGISASSPFAPPECFETINNELETLFTLMSDNDNGADFRRAACIYSILGELLCHEKTADKNLWVQKALGIMETKYDEKLTVASIADDIGLERSYFSTLFKSCMGSSPHDYLTSLRISKACVFIKEQHFSVSETAEAVGIDPKNFSRIFKQEIGVSPLKYKKQNK